MTQIGYLKPHTRGTQQDFIGEIKTLQLQLKVRFVPNALRVNGNEPDFLIYAMNYAGEDIQVGAAWRKAKQNPNGMTEFLTITIDDPSLVSPLNVAAFKRDDGGYDVSWRRRQVPAEN